VVEPYAGEHWVPSVSAGDGLHDAMNEIELGAHWIGERERVHVSALACSTTPPAAAVFSESVMWR